ncbi:MAG TPA: GNAT family protein [Armatimonadota bacterium]|jgi:hypothetical protein
MRYNFPLINQQLSIRLDCDLAAVTPGKVTVVETPRRLAAEEHFSYVRALWWMWLADGRSVLSVPPGVGPEIAALIAGIDDPHCVHDPALAMALRGAIDRALGKAGLPGTHQVFTDYSFACNADLLRRYSGGDCRRLTNAMLPHADDLWWPVPCINDSIAYGVLVGDVVSAIAYAHRTAIMPGQVVDVAVCTAEAHRRRGYARTAVSALVAHAACTGGEARYTCDVDNLASIATARSVGFVEYGVSLSLLAPAGGSG